MRPLGARERTIHRPGESSNVDGVYIEGPETTYTAVMTVASLGGKRRQWIKDDFIRLNAEMVSLSMTQIQASSDKHTGDQIEIKGRRYTFHEENDQDMPGSPLKHYKYYLISSGVKV